MRIAQLDIAPIPELPSEPVEAARWRSRPGFVRLFADVYDDPFDVAPITALVVEDSAMRTRAPAPTRRPSLAGAIAAFADTPSRPSRAGCLIARTPLSSRP